MVLSTIKQGMIFCEEIMLLMLSDLILLTFFFQWAQGPSGMKSQVWSQEGKSWTSVALNARTKVKLPRHAGNVFET